MMSTDSVDEPRASRGQDNAEVIRSEQRPDGVHRSIYVFGLDRIDERCLVNGGIDSSWHVVGYTVAVGFGEATECVGEWERLLDVVEAVCKMQQVGRHGHVMPHTPFAPRQSMAETNSQDVFG